MRANILQFDASVAASERTRRNGPPDGGPGGTQLPDLVVASRSLRIALFRYVVSLRGPDVGVARPSLDLFRRPAIPRPVSGAFPPPREVTSSTVHVRRGLGAARSTKVYPKRRGLAARSIRERAAHNPFHAAWREEVSGLRTHHLPKMAASASCRERQLQLGKPICYAPGNRFSGGGFGSADCHGHRIQLYGLWQAD